MPKRGLAKSKLTFDRYSREEEQKFIQADVVSVLYLTYETISFGAIQIIVKAFV